MDEETIVMLTLQARDEASEALRQIEEHLKGVTDAGHAANDALRDIDGGPLSDAMGQIGDAVDGLKEGFDALRLVAVAAFDVMAVQGINAANQFESASAKMRVNAALTAAELETIGDAIQTVSVGSSYSAVQLMTAFAPFAGSLERITGRSLEASDVMKLLSEAMDLADATGGNLGSQLRTLMNLFQLYGTSIGDVAGISDALFQGQARLGVGVEQLGSMFQRIQPRIAGSGVDLQMMLGIIDELGKSAGTGTRAVTLVASGIQKLMNPSQAATKAMNALGIGVRDAEGNFIGVLNAVEMLKRAYDGLGKQTEKNALLQSLFGGQWRIFEPLIKGGSAALLSHIEALKATGGATEAAAVMNDTYANKLATVRAQGQNVAQVVGQTMVGGLKNFLDSIIPVATSVAGFTTANEAAVGPLLSLLGVLSNVATFADGLPNMLAPVRKAISLIGGPTVLLGAAVASLFVIFRDSEAVMGPFVGLFKSLETALNAVIPRLAAVGSGIKAFLGGESADAAAAAIGDLVDTLVYQGERVGKELLLSFEAVLPRIKGFFESLETVVTDALGWVDENITTILSGIEQVVRRVGPKIVAALGGLGDAIIDWAVNDLAPMLVSIASKIVGWLIPKLPEIEAAARSLIVALAKAVIAAGSELASAGVRLVTDFFSGFGKNTSTGQNQQAFAAAILLLLEGVAVRGAIVAAATVAGGLYTLTFRAAATAASMVSAFAWAFVEALLPGPALKALAFAKGLMMGNQVKTGMEAAKAGTTVVDGLGKAVGGAAAANSPLIMAARTLGVALGQAIAAAAIPFVAAIAGGLSVNAIGEYLLGKEEYSRRTGYRDVTGMSGTYAYAAWNEGYRQRENGTWYRVGSGRDASTRGYGRATGTGTEGSERVAINRGQYTGRRDTDYDDVSAGRSVRGRGGGFVRPVPLPPYKPGKPVDLGDETGDTAAAAASALRQVREQIYQIRDQIAQSKLGAALKAAQRAVESTADGSIERAFAEAKVKTLQQELELLKATQELATARREVAAAEKDIHAAKVALTKAQSSGDKAAIAQAKANLDLAIASADLARQKVDLTKTELDYMKAEVASAAAEAQVQMAGVTAIMPSGSTLSAGASGYAKNINDIVAGITSGATAVNIVQAPAVTQTGAAVTVTATDLVTGVAAVATAVNTARTDIVAAITSLATGRPVTQTGTPTDLASGIAAVAFAVNTARTDIVAAIMSLSTGAVSTSTVSATGVAGGVTPTSPTINITAQIYLDGKVMAGAISRVLFNEERTYSGPIVVTSGL